MTAFRKGEQTFPAPVVQSPVYACQQYAVVTGCTPGANVGLLVNGVPIADTCSGGTSVTLWGPGGGFAVNTSLTAVQRLCGFLSNPSPPVPVLPTAQIPRPAVRGPLYDGASIVDVAITVAGETVQISADGTQIGMGGGSGGDVILNVDPPLVAGQTVIATVTLCGVAKVSLPAALRAIGSL